MTWRNARSLLTLRDEFDRAFPNRDRASDGTIGNASHRAEGWTASDHNPWVTDSQGRGVVRAFDFDCGRGLYPSEANDTPGDALLHAILQAAKAGHPALGAGSYLIYERLIYSPTSKWGSRPYHGSSPHEEHVHLSVGRAPSSYDSTKAWGLSGAVSIAAPRQQKALPLVRASVIRPGVTNYSVGYVQRALNKALGSTLAIDGRYGPNTATVARHWQARLFGAGSKGVDGDLGYESLAELARVTGIFQVAK